VTNADRKRAIREIMAETGMSWTAALRELGRRRTGDDVRQVLEQARERAEQDPDRA